MFINPCAIGNCAGLDATFQPRNIKLFFKDANALFQAGVKSGIDTKTNGTMVKIPTPDGSFISAKVIEIKITFDIAYTGPVNVVATVQENMGLNEDTQAVSIQIGMVNKIGFTARIIDISSGNSDLAVSWQAWGEYV